MERFTTANVHAPDCVMGAVIEDPMSCWECDRKIRWQRLEWVDHGKVRCWDCTMNYRKAKKEQKR